MTTESTKTAAKKNHKPTMSVDELAYKAWIGEKMSEYNEWKKASDLGTMKDDNNPMFLMSGVDTDILTKIISGKISPLFLASMELANRGLDKQGKWVGFPQAQKIHFSI